MWQYLYGDDLLLLAPRRVGKTSLMLRLRDTAGARGLEAAYLSVAGVEQRQRFRFLSPLLREYWLRRVVP